VRSQEIGWANAEVVTALGLGHVATPSASYTSILPAHSTAASAARSSRAPAASICSRRSAPRKRAFAAVLLPRRRDESGSLEPALAA
jgi:hypothetical protein